MVSPRRVLSFCEFILCFSVCMALFLYPVECSAAAGAGAGTGLSAAEEPLQVHLVPHTHDDVGWLKTVDQYYMGSNNSIQLAGVQYILDSVIPQLLADPEKTFIYVEIAFFERWWNEQSDAMKASVKKLVSSGQLEFINGGWCMNDEATTHYSAIVNQMELGHAFLLENFNVKPRIGWHIDPFGHSSEQASIFARMGFDAFFFARIHYADKEKRQKEKELEMIWRGSKSLGSSVDMFTSVLYAHYSAPSGFCFDLRCRDQPIQNDPRLFDVNVAERAKALSDYAKQQATNFTHNNIMFTMGDDFTYQNANMWYKNIDKLLAYFQEHPELGIHAFYSTPSRYVDAVNKMNQKWTVKTDDFFPYADHPFAYWTGYFTSRPALKGYVRQMSAYLQACESMSSLFPSSSANADWLSRAMAVAQHHDAVTGTERQHVQDDYAKRLAIGESQCIDAINSGLFEALSSQSDQTLLTNSVRGSDVFVQCPLLNETICDITGSLPSSSLISITFTSPIGKYKHFARIPVPNNSSVYTVTDEHQNIISSVVVPTPKLRPTSSPFTLVFGVDMRGYLARTYTVKVGASRSEQTASPASAAASAAGLALPIELPRAQDPHYHPSTQSYGFATDKYTLTFDASSGLLQSVSSVVGNPSAPITSNIKQELLWYNASSNGDDESWQPSGAYIFRPNTSTPFPLAKGPVKLTYVESDKFTEIYQNFSEYGFITWRLYPEADYVDIEYEIGPIAIKDNWGKEIVSRFVTDIDNDHTFYTDANGREFQERVRNHRNTWQYNNTDPVSGNYYPVNAAAYIRDGKRQLSFVTDRSVGCTSIASGSLEFMLHRRLLHDDGRGVAQPLNETGITGEGLIIRTTHRMILSELSSSASTMRPLMEQVFTAFTPVFHPPAYDSFNKFALAPSAPRYFNYPSDSVMVQKFLLKDGGSKAFIRIAHMYSIDEQPLSQQQQQQQAPLKVQGENVNVNIDFSTFFNSKYISEVVSAQELSLSGNQPLADVHRLHWNTDSTSVHDNAYTAVPLTGLSFTLQPMEIRTFLLDIHQ